MSSDTDRPGMETPGTLIREARKAKGLTLSEVAAVTRISRTRLRHLEADRWEEYSADIFIRGHLEIAAREVGVEPEIVLKSFQAHAGRPSRREPAGQAPETTDGPEASDSAPPEPPSWEPDWRESFGNLAPAHLAAAGLVLAVVVLALGLLTGHPATAQDEHEFEEESSETTEEHETVDHQTDRSRWLLEGEDGSDDAAK